MSSPHPLRVVHLADLHLGYTGPADLLVGGDQPDAGRPLREVDIERACTWIVDQLATLTPCADLVLVAGDLFHRANPLPRAITAAAQLVAGIRAAGAEVVLIDGNHDAPGRLAHGSPLEFLTALGAHVATGKATQIGPQHWRNPRLHSVVVHALPGSAQPEEHDGLQPIDGHINLLLAHGRAGAQDEPSGRRGAAALSSALLRRGWTYMALGDWHGHRHQPLAHLHAYYPGSLQALHFGEGRRHPPQASDPYRTGGMLVVDLTPEPVVTSLCFEERRPVLRLEAIDAGKCTAQDILDRLESAVRDLPATALVSVTVQQCSPQVLATIDRVRLAEIKGRCLALDVVFEEHRPEIQPSEVPPLEASIQDQWAAYLGEYADPDDDVPWLTERGAALFTRAQATLSAQDLETA